MTQEELEEARRQLDELAQKLGVYVSACGCCQSPWLTSIEDARMSIDYVKIGEEPEGTPHFGEEEGV